MMLTACALLAQLLVRPWSQTNEPLAARVARDFKDVPHAASFVHYAVPPMSEVQRLKDVYPHDGQPGGTVRIVMAQDEYEPGSFLVWALEDLGKTRLEVGELKKVEKVEGVEKVDGEVVFPKENVDLKFVKVWYQNKNGWYSYFGDTGFKLCPELLLNDEDLIRVDETKEANYARLKFDDGTVKERWLNPPRQLDRHFWNNYRGGGGFQSMRKEFCDAETLQPVTLPKEEFRQFFLTVHATKTTPPGLYRGKVELVGRGGERIGSIPIEVTVLDFALPPPKCYGDDNIDFYVAFYEYNAIAMFMEENGGDYELAFRQFKSQIADHVAHNQSFSWVRGGISAESRRTVALMKEAGMQTDVLLGGIEVRRGKPEEMKQFAERQMKAAKKIYGAHTFYIGYGDEPSARWLAEQRSVYKAYQDAGFKFIIAGSDNVFYKAGYLYDWHNIAKTPENDTTTRLWNQFGSSPHVAWYANQHVGVENPSFNRRQNGLAPYLSGYSALCNYAHHFGPYNDDADTYKPMVLAYGHYRGVIDTLAWEGFREGLDDIRYATLAVKLARKAAKSSKTDLRYAGNLVLQHLALFDKERGDMDACRLELIAHIRRLRAMGVEVEKVEVEGRGREVEEKVEKVEGEKKVEKGADWKVEAQEALANFDPQAAYDIYIKAGSRQDALRLYDRGLLGDLKQASALARQMASDPKASFYERLCGWTWLFNREPAFADAHSPLRPGDKQHCTNSVIGSLVAKLTRAQPSSLEGSMTTVAYFGQRPEVIHTWKEYLRLLDQIGGEPDFIPSESAVIAYAGENDRAGAVAAAKRGLRNAKLKPEERYELSLMAETLTLKGTSEQIAAALRKTEPKIAGELDAKGRLQGYDRTGSAAMMTLDEALARGFAQYRAEVVAKKPTKTYVVKFSERPVAGAADWANLPFKPEQAVLDRTYGGGDTAFMTTDVATGNRGEATKGGEGRTTLEIVADVWGLHILRTFHDKRAREFERGFLDAGSFEEYIAPGENQPYACMLVYPKKDALASGYRTSYDGMGCRRIDFGNPTCFRSDVAFTDDAILVYTGISWNNYPTLIPVDGAVWDYESCFWGPKVCTWNGLETIHGRSTWGHLRFEMPESARLRILEDQICKAVASYKQEKVSRGGHEGVIEHWTDAVVGDPAFYAARVKPLETELDAVVARVNKDMTADDVRDIAENGLEKLVDLRYIVDRMRTEWLRDQLGGERK